MSMSGMADVESTLSSAHSYSNNHMGYFATVREYDVGGYESLLTMWGVGTAEKIRQSMKSTASKIKP